MFHARFMVLLGSLVLAGIGLIGCGEDGESQETLPPLPTATSLALQLVTANLTSPVFLTAAPGDGTRLFMVEQGGTIRIFDVVTGALLATPFLDIAGLITSGGEEGLLGMAFDPNYGANGRVYVFYTNTNGDEVIARYQRSLVNPNLADPSTATILQTVPHPTFANHNGGMLAFGPDGCLYAGIGDGGSGGDPNNNGQNSFSRLANFYASIQTQEAPATTSLPTLFSSAAGRKKSGAWGFAIPGAFHSIDKQATSTSQMWDRTQGKKSMCLFPPTRADSPIMAGG